MTRISQQFYNSEQSWHFERIVKHGKLRMRVDIRRNAYDFQSWVRGYIFDPVHMKWNLLVDRPIEGAKCEQASYVRKVESIAPFQADAESVLKELNELVSV
jgi:hypothetical protein